MSGPLFSLGHPCEHQLKRACIGGKACPLNGYPDQWCCSYVKGKIGFKRDKPCEGPRCRWGFEHPTNSQLEMVTTIINEGRAFATKIDETAASSDVCTFKFSSSHVIDTVNVAISNLKTSPISNAGQKVGQLFVAAALKAGDATVFIQLLKTMKKPVDPYLLGAYEYLQQHITQVKATQKEKPTKKSAEPEVHDELKSNIVDVMKSALSSNGQLVDRDDQHRLQVVYVEALRSYGGKNKKKAGMLEIAMEKFGAPRPLAPAGTLPLNEAVKPPTPPAEPSSGQRTPAETKTPPSEPLNAKANYAAAVTPSKSNAPAPKLMDEDNFPSILSVSSTTKPAAPAASHETKTVGGICAAILDINENSQHSDDFASLNESFATKYRPISSSLPDVLTNGGLFSLAGNANAVCGPLSSLAVTSSELKSDNSALFGNLGAAFGAAGSGSENDSVMRAWD